MLKPVKEPAARTPLLLVLLVTAAVLAPVCGHDFVRWDDTHNLVRNEHMHRPSLEGVGWYWTHPYADLYIPVTYTVWMGLAAVATVGPGELNSYVFHTFNLLVHLGSTAVVFLLLFRLLKSAWPAAAGAVLFGIHPVQVETVAWVSGLKDLLAGFFALLAVYIYLGFTEETATDGNNEKRWMSPFLGQRYWIATGCFVLAMLAKPSAVVVPLVAGGIDWLVNGRPLHRTVLSVVPWLILAGPIILIGKLVQPAHGVEALPVYLRPIVAADALGFYILQILAPIHLGIDYGRSPQWLMDSWQRYVTWIIPAGALVIAIFLCRRFRWALVALGVLIAGVLPVLGLVPFDFQSYSTVSDHYLYFAMLGPAILAAALLDRWKGHRGAFIVAAVILLGFGVRAFLQTFAWRDSEALFVTTIAVNPASSAGNVNLGLLHAEAAEQLLKAGDRQRAMAHAQDALALYQRALAHHPDDLQAHNNLANLYKLLGQWADAEPHFAAAARLNPTPERLTSLGTALAMQGKLDEAIEQFRAALALDPDYPPAKSNLALAERMKAR